jgi:hypothetical protein
MRLWLDFQIIQQLRSTDHIRVRVIPGTAPATTQSYFNDSRRASRAVSISGALKRKGDVMVKIVQAMLAAAVIAGVFTLLTAASDRLDAGPLPAVKEAVLKDCTQRPWPYLNCVGTPVGNPRVRLITTDRL